MSAIKGHAYSSLQQNNTSLYWMHNRGRESISHAYASCSLL